MNGGFFSRLLEISMKTSVGIRGKELGMVTGYAQRKCARCTRGHHCVGVATLLELTLSVGAILPLPILP